MLLEADLHQCLALTIGQGKQCVQRTFLSIDDTCSLDVTLYLTEFKLNYSEIWCNINVQMEKKYSKT